MKALKVEMFYLNTIEQYFLFVEQLFQLVFCLPYSRLLAGIPILAVFQNLWWNSNKTPLCINVLYSTVKNGVNFNVFNVLTLRFYHLESPLREAVKNCYFEDIALPI